MVPFLSPPFSSPEMMHFPPWLQNCTPLKAPSYAEPGFSAPITRENYPGLKWDPLFHSALWPARKMQGTKRSTLSLPDPPWSEMLCTFSAVEQKGNECNIPCFCFCLLFASRIGLEIIYFVYVFSFSFFPCGDRGSAEGAKNKFYRPHESSTHRA